MLCGSQCHHGRRIRPDGVCRGGGAVGGQAWHSFSSREPGGGNQIAVGSWSGGGGKRRRRMLDTRSGSLAAKKGGRKWPRLLGREKGSWFLIFLNLRGKMGRWLFQNKKTWVCLQKRPVEERPHGLLGPLTLRPPSSPEWRGASVTILSPAGPQKQCFCLLIPWHALGSGPVRVKVGRSFRGMGSDQSR